MNKAKTLSREEQAEHKACTSKMYFHSKAHARNQARRFAQSGGGGRGRSLKPYRCQYCDGYHMTSSSKRKDKSRRRANKPQEGKAANA